MKNISNIFLDKKILIYGLGKSGISTSKFLLNKSNIFLYDDLHLKIKNSKLNRYIVNLKKVKKIKFDAIILSPGIDINNCRLSKFLKKNHFKIFSDLDVFYEFYKNDCITITGTNGKSTTCKLLYEVLHKKKLDVRLVGNIGNPILSVKNVKKKTVFVIEASSYQLEYSKLFKSKFSAILNISPDHIERHKSLNKYVKAKFKLINNQTKNDYSFLKRNDNLISKELKLNKLESKIIKVDQKKIENYLKNIGNNYFLSKTNKENLSFVLAISRIFKIKDKLLKKTIQNFKGLRYRQQIILIRKNLTVINDSKSTSFSSTIDLLSNNKNIYWILGGIHKQGDKFQLSKKYFKNTKAFIYGKNKKFFIKSLKNKIEYQLFYDLKGALKKVIHVIKKNKIKNQTILFSPCAASFDSFKNFEDRGLFFNKLLKKYLNGI